eukprot:scaffold21455_cov116-Cylindrotheca_fusiformis.AAC.14
MNKPLQGQHSCRHRSSGGPRTRRDLVFPKLFAAADLNNRRSNVQRQLPAKRPRISTIELQSEDEDKSWIDSFLLQKDSFCVENRPFCNMDAFQEPDTGSSVAFKEVPDRVPSLDEGTTSHQEPSTFSCSPFPPSLIPLVESVDESQLRFISTTGGASLLTRRPINVAARSLSMKSSSFDRLDLPLAMNDDPLATPDKTMVDLLKASDEPMLLVLTSNPFQVVYANDAFASLNGKRPVIGESVFDSFTYSQDKRQGSMPLNASLLEKLQDISSSQVLVQASGTTSGVPCTLQVLPAFNKLQSNLYFAIRFTRANTQP